MKQRTLIFLISHFSFLICIAAPIQVQTDRTWYLAGEAMRVSIAADDAQIAYAELCDVQGLAAGVVVSLHERKGEGVIELPTDLHSGYYVLSVYTRNSNHVNQQLVPIVNPLYKSADDDIEWKETTHPNSLSCAEATQTSNLKPDLRSSLLTLGKADASIALLSLNRSLQISNLSTPETEGHIVRARVKNVHDGQTFKDFQIFPSLSIVGKQIHYFEGKMVNDSLAVFYTYGIHGKQPLVLAATTSTGKSLPIEMISPFVILTPESLPHLVFHYQRSEVEARSLDMQRHQAAIAPAKQELRLGENADDAAETGEPLDYDETVFGNKPDLTYNLDEYRQFYTVGEVLLEYVNCVSKRSVNDITQLFVRKEQEHYSPMRALVLIDGMPVFDIDRLLAYDARRIHYINIYANQYTFGSNVYQGILSFITRSGRLTNYPVERNMQYLVYQFP